MSPSELEQIITENADWKWKAPFDTAMILAYDLPFLITKRVSAAGI